MKEVEKAYIAGIIDGEGCISIQRRRGGHCFDESKRWSYQSQVYIGNTDKRMLEFIYRLCGGSIRTRQKLEGCKQTYTLSFTGNEAKKLLGSILPFLVVKKEQAENVLALRNYRHRGWGWGKVAGRTEKEELEQETLYSLNKALNRRGA